MITEEATERLVTPHTPHTFQDLPLRRHVFTKQAQYERVVKYLGAAILLLACLIAAASIIFGAMQAEINNLQSNVTYLHNQERLEPRWVLPNQSTTARAATADKALPTR